MQVPIPDDWDGETWFCSEVQWPDSPLWTALLAGALSMFTRGRVYDGRSGSILDAQAVGREIWARNFPFVQCGDDAPETPETPDGGASEQIKFILSLLDSDDESEECEMGCCLRWNNGVLEVFSCGAWTPVEGIGGIPVVDPDTALPDDWTEGQVDSNGDPIECDPCGAAYALTEAVFSIGNAVYEQADNFDFWKWVSDVESDVGMDLNNRYVYEAVVQSTSNLALDAADITDILDYSPGTVLDIGQRSNFRNMAVKYQTADCAGMTEEAFEKFKEAWASSFLPDAPLFGWWSHVLSALGPNKAREITAIGKSDGTRDCAGYDPYGAPADADWNYVYDFTQGPHDFLEAGNSVEGHYVANVGWEGSDNYVDGSIFNLQSGAVTGDPFNGTIKFVKATFTGAQTLVAITASDPGIRVVGVDTGGESFITELQIQALFPDVQWAGTWPYNDTGGGNKRFSIFIKSQDTEPENEPIVLTRLEIAGYGDAPCPAPLVY